MKTGSIDRHFYVCFPWDWNVFFSLEYPPSVSAEGIIVIRLQRKATIARWSFIEECLSTAIVMGSGLKCDGLEPELRVKSSNAYMIRVKGSHPFIWPRRSRTNADVLLARLSILVNKPSTLNNMNIRRPMMFCLTRPTFALSPTGKKCAWSQVILGCSSYF